MATDSSSLGAPSEAPAVGSSAISGSAGGSHPRQKSDIDALISREYAGLRLLIFQRTRDIHAASDLLNDAICTTWEKWQSGKIAHPEQIAGYVFQVAMNLLRNRRRAAGERSDNRADMRLVEQLPAEPVQDPVERGLAGKVLQIVRGMSSQRDRALIVRFYLDEEDKESICRDLQLTPDQFTKTLHRARRRLRELLEARGLRGTDLFSWLLL